MDINTAKNIPKKLFSPYLFASLTLLFFSFIAFCFPAYAKSLVDDFPATGFLSPFPIKVDSLIFTGGNSKNGPEYFFRKLLKTAKIPLECLDDQVPQKHQFYLACRTLTTYSLTAPSGTANRTIGSMPAYKSAKAQDPHYTTLDFRVEQYGRVFRENT